MLSEWKLDHKLLSWVLFVTASLFLVMGLIWYLLMWARMLIHPHERLSLVQSLDIPLLVPLLLLVCLVVLLRPRTPSITHGSAHWATVGELKKAQLINGQAHMRQAASNSMISGNNNSCQPESLLLVGYRGRYPIVLTERRQESHVLIVAPTGKRKSSGFFIPALLEERGHRSLVINDLKGELFKLTAGAVSKYHQVQLFSPTNPYMSHCYNPLAHIRNSKGARDFARAWVDNTGVSREEFYNTASRTLITALVFHLVDTEPNPPFSRLADIVTTRTLDEIKMLLLASRSDRARNTAHAFLQTIEANPKLSSGVMLGVANRFSSFVGSEDYRQVTATNEIDFKRMVDGKRPTALYLQVPASAIDDLKPLTSVFVMQLMNFLTSRAEQEQDGRLPRPFCFYLDEFANVGRIPDIEKHITLVRGAGIAIIGALQDFGQSKRIYGEEATDTFLSNFSTQIVLPGLGQEEAEYYSHRLGYTTSASTSYSFSSKGSSVAVASTSKTIRETQRELMQPDEIRTMSVGSFIMVSDNAPPVRGQFKTYIERPELQPLLNVRVRRVVVNSRSGQQPKMSAVGLVNLLPPETL
jgi:type IV secretion system protein VirD4